MTNSCTWRLNNTRGHHRTFPDDAFTAGAACFAGSIHAGEDEEIADELFIPAADEADGSANGMCSGETLRGLLSSSNGRLSDMIAHRLAVKQCHTE